MKSRRSRASTDRNMVAFEVGGVAYAPDILLAYEPAKRLANTRVMIEQGEALSYLTSGDGWYKVRAKEGTGWIAQEMVERRGNKSVIIEYEMKGYGIVFLAGVVLLVVGVVQKQK